MLTFDHLHLRLGDRVLFEDASLTIPAGHRVGVIGRNGAGKTTLFRLILGDLAPTAGEVSVAQGMRVTAVAQEAPGGPERVRDVVLAADTERAGLLAELDGDADPMRVGEIHARLEEIGAHGAEARAARILSGLGFDETAQQAPCSSFSGGWRMRIALAAALFSEPDLLLLDEPTNYLDIEGTMWLEQFLARYPRTFLLISHERGLMNKAVDHILHVAGGDLTLYAGGYDRFARTRAERLRHEAAEAKRIDAQRAHMQAFVDRFRAKATKARQAQSRLKALAKLADVPPPPSADAVPDIRFDAKEVPAPPLLMLEDASAGYVAGKAVLSGITLRLDPDDRIALLGRNGNGKSTLAKLIAGRLDLFGGRRTAAAKMRVGYFAQHQADELDMGASPIDHLARKMPGAEPKAVRAVLGRWGFPGERAETAVAKLSGGEKARLLLALLAAEKPNLLILDEPTNHLDMETRGALVTALNDFEGAVILVSHDPDLVESVADRLLLVDKGRVQRFDGDLDDYRALVLREAGSDGGQAPKPADAARATKKDDRKAAAQLREQLKPLRQKVQAAEKEMERLASTIAGYEADLADTALHAQRPQEAARIAKARADAMTALAAAEEAWLAASEALESAQAEAGS
ncbi:ABC-F family ATP-binding cassette domain-containing protein [Futiania mangrovi]|uniref:ATP-binding cassette domain-containing protein n=1 Tax=Futiania mangrovi TaxID=2959716 RepID=A0A9J6PCX7_9PROT|nr:ABC-F family ATP-binding cassette domain-containing protein [Futiania mangrovii]MCP1335656.1 ATP-binding cassette domain-containing protein [Futiania mangrovii]